MSTIVAWTWTSQLRFHHPMTWRRLPPAGIGTSMAVASMCFVQLGIAASVGLFDQIGPEGAAWLRLAWAGVIMAVVARPWQQSWTRSGLATCVLLGVVTGAITLLFMAAVARIPLGTASALEFLGPLTVALVHGRASARVWALLAGAGVLLLTERWHGGTDLVGIAFALSAAVCWACYILLTQRAADEVTGLRALGVSMPVAAVVATLVAGHTTFGLLTWQLLVVGFGLALLLPVIPFCLELLALRRLTTASFGTLMSLEPAIATLIGVVVLSQLPTLGAVVGITLVVAAGIGATRTGARTPAPLPGTVTDLAGTG
jgi:inner membrane transporter RhtA